MQKRKRGRPRKEKVTRYNNGRIRPANQQVEIIEDDPPPIVIKRLYTAALKEIIDPCFATPLGILFAAREITASEYAAGLEYQRRKLEYARAIAAISQTGHAAGLLVPRKIVAESTVCEQTREQVRTAQRAIRRFETGRDAVLALGGRQRYPFDLLDCVERVCVEMRYPSWAEKDKLSRGLRALANCYGYTVAMVAPVSADVARHKKNYPLMAQGKPIPPQELSLRAKEKLAGVSPDRIGAEKAP